MAVGTCTQEFGTLASWQVDVLNVLTGHLDEAGGAMFPKAAAFASNTAGIPGSGRCIVTGRHRSRVSGAPEVFGELPMTCLAEEIETPGAGQVRALITVASTRCCCRPMARDWPGRWTAWTSWSAWTSTSMKPRAMPS